jgi:hypothetical protein
VKKKDQRKCNLKKIINWWMGFEWILGFKWHWKSLPIEIPRLLEWCLYSFFVTAYVRKGALLMSFGA